jgi:hypothetical protein
MEKKNRKKKQTEGVQIVMDGGVVNRFGPKAQSQTKTEKEEKNGGNISTRGTRTRRLPLQDSRP